MTSLVDFFLKVFQACASMPDCGYFYPPTLVTNVSSTSTIVIEEVCFEAKYLHPLSVYV